MSSQDEGVEVGDAWQLVACDDDSHLEHGHSQSLSLLLSHGDPRVASAVAVFGLSLPVLPLLQSLQGSRPAAAQTRSAKLRRFSYARVSSPALALLKRAELPERFGSLDAAFLAQELLTSARRFDLRIHRCSLKRIHFEASALQKWRRGVKANLEILRKRSALSFLGLSVNASQAEINKVYKKMALEMHPDKGGDLETFQHLQSMKERLSENGKAEDEDVVDDGNELALSTETSQDRIKKCRKDAWRTVKKLWLASLALRDELPSSAVNAQPMLNLLRRFTDRFVRAEFRGLGSDPTRALLCLRSFVKQGAEILAVASLVDAAGTSSIVAMRFTYPLILQCSLPEVKRESAALLDAIGCIPAQVSAFLALETQLTKICSRGRRPPVKRNRIWGLSSASKRRRQENSHAVCRQLAVDTSTSQVVLTGDAHESDTASCCSDSESDSSSESSTLGDLSRHKAKRRFSANSSGRCIVCTERPADATFVHGDTGHTACCLPCAQKLQRTSGQCPVCRQDFSAVIKNFIA